MITYKNGDILKALESGEIEIFGHGTNCSNGFGSGIAGQIAKKYPNVKKEFHDNYLEFQNKLGTVQFVRFDGKQIANCYTQENYGYNGDKFCSYDAIDSSMKELYEYCKANKLKVGLPKIGCGLAGGKWSIVEAIINEAFQDMEVIVYEFNS